MTSLSYTLRDEGSGPLLVLSHALGMDRHAWDPLLAQWGAGARTLTFDHPGHGRSPALPDARTMDALVDEAAALLRDVAHEPVVWVGASMGGMVGLGLAIRHPALLKGLVVANATARYPEAARQQWTARIETVQQAGLPAIADTVMQRYFHPAFRAAQPDAVQQARSTLLAMKPGAYLASCEAVRDVDWQARLACNAVPTLVIAGALDEGTPPAMALAIADQVPDAELAILPQASHISAVEQPAAFARRVRAFVRDRCTQDTKDAQDERDAQSTRAPLGPDDAVRGSTTVDEAARGTLNRRRILGDAWVDRSIAHRTTFNREFQDLIARHAWHDIWGRPALGDRLRRFIVMSMMLGIHAWDEFALHVRAALDSQDESRLTPDDIKEIILMAAIYCGVPVANHATGIVNAILRERGLDQPA